MELICKDRWAALNSNWHYYCTLYSWNYKDNEFPSSLTCLFWWKYIVTCYCSRGSEVTRVAWGHVEDFKWSSHTVIGLPTSCNWSNRILNHCVTKSRRLDASSQCGKTTICPPYILTPLYHLGPYEVACNNINIEH